MFSDAEYYTGVDSVHPRIPENTFGRLARVPTIYTFLLNESPKVDTLVSIPRASHILST